MYIVRYGREGIVKVSAAMYHLLHRCEAEKGDEDRVGLDFDRLTPLVRQIEFWRGQDKIALFTFSSRIPAQLSQKLCRKSFEES